MSRYRVILLLVMVSLLLAGCTIRLPMTARGLERPLPTIGPITQASGGPDSIFWQITSSTNCAEIGEMVTFSVQLVNETTYPVTITNTPLLDIVIQPAQWPFEMPEPVQRWSEARSYPREMSPILAPGEVRRYQWQWQADAVYGQYGVNGVKARFITGTIQKQHSSTPAGGVDVWVGVRTMPGGEVAQAGIECAALPRP